MNITNSTLQVRRYLEGNIGSSSDNYLSELLKPKKSTLISPSGSSRDKGRSILTKMINQFNKKGNQRSVIKYFRVAAVMLNSLAVSGKRIPRGIKSKELLKQIKFIALAHKHIPFSLTDKILTLVNNATPRVYLKNHCSNQVKKKKRIKETI